MVQPNCNDHYVSLAYFSVKTYILCIYTEYYVVYPPRVRQATSIGEDKQKQFGFKNLSFVHFSTCSTCIICHCGLFNGPLMCSLTICNVLCLFRVFVRFCDRDLSRNNLSTLDVGLFDGLQSLQEM